MTVISIIIKCDGCDKEFDAMKEMLMHRKKEERDDVYSVYTRHFCSRCVQKAVDLQYPRK